MFSRDELIYRHQVRVTPEDSRYRLVELVADARSVLDVGCATGYLGQALRRKCPGIWLAGIEVDATAARQAREHYDELAVESIEDPLVWHQFTRPFDAMIFGDVLEHTRDPLTVLKLSSTALRDGGFIVVSVPNVAFFKTRLRLLRGVFEYEETGIMDRTHLRFFTLKTGRELLRQAGFRLMRTEGVYGWPPPEGASRLARLYLAVRGSVRGPLTRLWPALFAYQFIFVAAKDRSTADPVPSEAMEVAREPSCRRR